MLNSLNRIWTTVYINYKSLRFNLMHYLMLVVVFPLSYLVMNIIASNGKISITQTVIGAYTSMIISLFFNLFAIQVSSANEIQILELYRTAKVKVLEIFCGNGLFYTLLSVFMFIVMVLITAFNSIEFNLFRLVLCQIICFSLLSTLGIVIGSLIRNPSMAGPIINLIYMICVIVTPIYLAPYRVDGILKHLYFINPLSHVVWINYWGYDQYNGIELIKSIAYILLVVILGWIYIFKRWNNTYSTEKKNII